ncbi:phage head closure protein [Aeromonas sp. Y301-2]|uniref:phage head closure protein n=1 Tax=unclassified Aeromonas TaxID=257493 RepID=UPI0022E91AD6|nr:phage head closure protein [Aeromonas sp. Y301-2]
MAAGKLRDRVTLLTRAPGRDGAGQAVDQWQPSPPIWADVRMIGGREQLRAGKEIAAGQYTIQFRYRPGVTTAQRLYLVQDQLSLNIKLVQPDARRQWLILTCEVDS